jgi:hypothetical protein
MAELGWKTHPVEPPEAIEALIEELKRGSVDERHLEWDVDFLMNEAVALFRAEVVLLNAMRNTEVNPELRAKREPFLTLAARIVEAERNARLDRLWELIGKLRGK